MFIDLFPAQHGPFLKGLPAIALAQGTRAGDISKKDSTEACTFIIFEVSLPENKSHRIMLFETSKIIIPPMEPLDIALRE
jgi:hypothetical protein